MARFIGRGNQNFVELAGAASRVSAIGVILSEDPASSYRWELAIDATTRERGTTRVGRMISVPPAAFDGLPGAVQRRSSGRLVAIAACPNAVSWKVTGTVIRALDGTSPLDAAILDCTLVAFEYSPISQGLIAVNADALGGPELAEQTAAQVAIPAGVATLIADYDADRAQLLISNAGAGDLNVGPTPSANVVDYYRVPTGQQYETRAHRPVWAFSVAGTTASFFSTRY